MGTVRGKAIAFVAAMGLALPATAEEWPWSITAGIRGGSNTTEISGLESTSPHVGPLVDLTWGPLSLGFAFLWAEFDAGSVDLEVPLPDLIAQIGGPATLDLPPTRTAKVNRFDYDVSLKYRLNQYFTPFIGYRLERFPAIGFDVGFDDPAIQQTFGDISQLIVQALQSGAITTDQAASLQDLAVVPDDLPELNLDLQYFAVGTSAGYPIAEWKVIPFVLLTGFPWLQVEKSSDHFAGFAIEGGVAYLFGQLIDQPMYLTATVKFQKIDSDVKITIFDPIFPGISDLFPAEEEFFNTNVAVFYRFDL